MAFFSGFSALIALAMPHVADAGLDIPAQPIDRAPPAYPLDCIGENDAVGKQDLVLVIYDVNAQGRTENIRVQSSSNDCFNAAAIAAVEQWVFEPRTIDGMPATQENVNTKLTFILDEELSPDLSRFEGMRIQAQYPEKCMKYAKPVERVTIRYDVNAKGRTENVRVIATTNKCLNEAAVRSVERWIYEPKIVDGEAVARKDIETVVTFALEE